MNYFRKTKFRESSLIIVALFVAIVYFTTNIISYEQSKDVQELIDARVEEALKEATTTTFPATTTTTTIVAPNLDYENGCSSLLDKYNDKSIYLAAIESPFPGEIISKIYTVKGCSRSFEGTIYWELIDKFGNTVERNFTNGGAYEMDLFEFEIDTTVFEDGKYFLRVYEIDESGGESSLKLNETLLQIYISNS